MKYPLYARTNIHHKHKLQSSTSLLAPGCLVFRPGNTCNILLMRFLRARFFGHNFLCTKQRNDNRLREKSEIGKRSEKVGPEAHNGSRWRTTGCKAWFTFFLGQILMLFRVTNCLNCVVTQPADTNWLSLDWAWIHLIFIHIIEMNLRNLDLSDGVIEDTPSAGFKGSGWPTEG